MGDFANVGITNRALVADALKVEGEPFTAQILEQFHQAVRGGLGHIRCADVHGFIVKTQYLPAVAVTDVEAF